MNTQFVAISPAMVAMIGAALMNFIWQGALIGVATSVLLRLLRNAHPNTRYALAITGLLACLAAPLLSLAYQSGGVAAAGSVTAEAGPFRLDGMSDFDVLQIWSWMQNHIAGIVAAWGLFVVGLSIRMVVGLAWIRRATGSLHSRSNPHWQARLDRLVARAGIQRKVALRELSSIASPAVAGWLRPVVLLPAALVSGMPPDLLEVLLAHEVAHIKRMDYVVNLAQSAVEILLFYHPAVWWISKQVRIEREKIADDLAATWTGDPHRLAVALSKLEQFQYTHAQLSLSASGGDLVDRIRRLTAGRRQSTGSALVVSLVTLLCAGSVLVAHAATEPGKPAGTVTEPHATLNFASCAKPVYPKAALDSKFEGTVHMAFASDITGRVTDAKVLSSSGHPDLDSAALNTLKLCSFKPAIVDGKPVSSTQTVDYVWKVNP